MKKLRCAILIVVSITLTSAFFLLREKEEKYFERGDVLELEIRSNKEKIISFAESCGTEIDAKTKIISRFVPELLDVIVVFEYTGEKDDALRPIGISVNGYEISEEVLGNISENYLDFRCSLVYN